MRISPCNYSVSRKSTINKKNECSFRANYDYGNIMKKGDGIIYKRGTIKNYTNMFRGIRMFKELPQFLQKKYPYGAPIYDYACSTGHEASSLVISLFDALPDAQAKKFLPIKALDNNPKILKKTKNHTLVIGAEEESVFRFFESTKKDEYLKPIGTSYGERLYKMQEKLTENIHFGYGDIFEDLKDDKLPKEPIILCLRNMWQFLTKDGAKDLAAKLFEKLPPKSTLIIGEMDVMENSAHELLKRAGFKPVKENVVCNFRNQRLYSWYETMEEGIKEYCFELP